MGRLHIEVIGCWVKWRFDSMAAGGGFAEENWGGFGNALAREVKRVNERGIQIGFYGDE
jgi:hypothetical protein